MTKNFAFSLTKDKRQNIILTMSYFYDLQVLIATASWKFLFLIVIFKPFVCYFYQIFIFHQMMSLQKL